LLQVASCQLLVSFRYFMKLLKHLKHLKHLKQNDILPEVLLTRSHNLLPPEFLLFIPLHSQCFYSIWRRLPYHFAIICSHSFVFRVCFPTLAGCFSRVQPCARRQIAACSPTFIQTFALYQCFYFLSSFHHVYHSMYVHLSRYWPNITLPDSLAPSVPFLLYLLLSLHDSALEVPLVPFPLGHLVSESWWYSATIHALGGNSC